MSTAYEDIQAFCRSEAGVSDGTYTENMIQAAQEIAGLTRDMTADEAEMLILQTLSGDLTDTLPGLRTLWPGIIAGFGGTLLLEDGFDLLLEDGTSLLLLE